MPRTKSKPIHRAQNEAALTQNSEIFAELDSDLESTEPSAKKKLRSKREPTCFYCIWTTEHCEILKKGKPTIIPPLLICNSSICDSFHLGKIEVPLDILMGIPFERLVLSLTSSVIYFSDSDVKATILCHYHLPIQISHAISSLNKTALSFQLVSNNNSAIDINLYILTTASVMPSVLTWLQPEKFSTFDWYGDNRDLSLKSNQFLSSFSTTWALGSKDELISLTNEIRSAGIATSLRQYQVEGVDWMWKMLIRSSPHILSSFFATYPGWINIDLSQSLYYNEVWKSFMKQNDLATTSLSSSISSCILADEMGIGKSLQVLSFILLLRSRIDRGIYLERTGFDNEVCLRISSFFESREISTSSSSQRQRRKSAIRSEVGCEIPCLCERSELEESDIGWVNCSICQRPRHLRCANLLHPNPQYQCLSCTSTYFYHHPICSKTTLIIIPGTLTNQWLNEVRRHVYRNTSLRVCVYRGKKTVENLSKLTPQFLSTFDIIFISFKALKGCFHEADLDWKTTVNTNRRYDVFPPPLLGLEFSLIVIDETQNIEGATENMILKMAMKLRARRKLSVSGTPFGGGTVKDLLHLAQFLEIPSLHTNDKTINLWASFFEHPVLPISVEIREQWLKELFEPRILRRTKDIVREQLGIAERFTLIRSLRMSDFEKKLYVDNVQTINNDLMARSVSVHFEELGKAKIELIRKACCHPRIFDPSLQLGRAMNLGSIASFGLSSSSSIDNIMIMKVEQTKVRCEEAQRDLLFYLFKLAGLRLLQAQSSVSIVEAKAFQISAVSIYQFAVNLINQHRSSSSSYALFQLVGDDYFDNSHLIVPCFASLNLTWTIFDYVLPFQIHDSLSPHNSSHHWSSTILESLAKDNDLFSCEETISTASLSKEWYPFVRLGMMHKKTLLDIDVAPVPTWEIEQYCRDQINMNSKIESLLVLFPSEFSLSASDFHDSFNFVVTKTSSSPLTYFVSSSTSSSITPTATAKVSFQAEHTYRAKQWKISVHSCHIMALMVTQKMDTVSDTVLDSPLQFTWISSTNVSFKSFPHVRMWAKFSLSETLFDTDLLQELHVQYNVHQTLKCLTSPVSVLEVMSEPEPVDDVAIPIATSVNQLDQFSYTNTQHIANEGIISSRNDSDKFNSIIEQAAMRKSFIEKDFLGSAVERRNFAYLKWQEATEKVQTLENEILEKSHSRDWWSGFMMEKLQYHDGFWQDVVDTVERGELAYAHLRSTITGSSSVASGIAGLLIALKKEFHEMSKARKAALKSLQLLNSTPSELDISQASNCQQCRAYFHRQGGVCAHCHRFNQYLQPYQKKFLSAARRRTTHVVCSAPAIPTAQASHKNKQMQQKLRGADSLFHDQEQLTTKAFEEGVVDGTYAMLMKLMKKHAARVLPTNNDDVDNNASTVEERNILLELTKLEIQWVEAVLQEAQAMVSLWDRYSELLKTYDEIQQCVSRVQLAGVGNGDVEGAESFHSEQLPTEYQATICEAIQAETYLKETISTLHFFRRQLEHYNQEMLLLAAFEYSQQHKNDSKESESEVAAAYATNTSLTVVTNETCGICQESMLLTEARVFLPCAHRFHVDCVNSWLQRHRRCPYCRNPTTEQDVRILQASAGFSDKSDEKRQAIAPAKNSKSSILDVFDSSGRVVHTSPHMISEEEPIITSIVSGTGEDFSRMLKRVKGRWGTKIDALLADILLIVQNPARREEKGIIFSQWTEMLEIVADALRMNDVKFTCCFNRQRDFEQQGVGIEAFRHNPELRMLLMPLHLGAEGLDLIVANHVFLLEPLLNYSQEAQAINRIDRLGQLQKATFVHKYLLLETIEERIVVVKQRLQLHATGTVTDSDPNATLTAEIIHSVQEEDSNGSDMIRNDNVSSSQGANTWTPHNNPPLPEAQYQRMITPSRTQQPTSAKKRKKMIGDDDILDVNDVKYILSLTSPHVETFANNSNSATMEAISSLNT